MRVARARAVASRPRALCHTAFRVHIAPPRVARSSSAASKARNPRGKNAPSRTSRVGGARHRAWATASRDATTRDASTCGARGLGRSESSRVVHRHTRLRIRTACPSFSYISQSTWHYSCAHAHIPSSSVLRDAPRDSECVAMRAPRRSRVTRERRARGNIANERA